MGGAIPRRIAFINEKGGCGKTTLVANIAVYLARERGRRTLAIDMDPQGQLGKVLGLEIRRPKRSSIELLVDSLLGTPDASKTRAGAASTRDTAAVEPSLPISHTRFENLDVIVSNKSLALLPLTLDGGPVAGRSDSAEGAAERRLARSLTRSPELAGYDYVLIDAPPTFGPLTLSVLLASEEIAVPVPLTFLALDGFAELQRTIAMVQQRYGHRGLRVSMVIPNFHRRTRMAQEVLEKLQKRFPREIARTVVGFHVKIDEAQSRGLSIFEYAPRDRGAKAMAELALELEERGSAIAAPDGPSPSRAAAPSPAETPASGSGSRSTVPGPA